MCRKMYFLLLGLLLVLMACDTSDTKKSKQNGALEALRLFSQQRAYPNKTIPKVGYVQAFEKLRKKEFFNKNVDSLVAPWLSEGPFNTAGRTLALALNPLADSTIYLGSASGGLWRSRKLGDGLSWEYVDTGFPILGVSSIVFPPNDSMTMYIGTGEVYHYQNVGTDAAYRSTRGSYGMGILKSEDGGENWRISLDWSYEQLRGINMLKISEANPNKIYAATSEGLYISNDEGENWFLSLDVQMVMDVLVHHENDQIIIAACGNFGSEGNGLYRTDDGGDTWTFLKGEAIPEDFNGKIQLAQCSADSDVMYASIGNGFSLADGATWLLRSTDGGVEWELRCKDDYSSFQGWFAHDVAVHPKDCNEVSAVGLDIWHSHRGGTSLEKRSSGGVTLGMPESDQPDGPPNYSHADHHVTMFHPNNPSIILYGNDGGLFVSSDGGHSFKSANGGLVTSQFYNGFSVSHQRDDYAMGGLQDNSTVIYSGDGDWRRTVGGDGAYTGIPVFHDRVQFASFQNLNIVKSLDAGRNFNSYLDFKESDDVPIFIAPYKLSQSREGVMYAGGQYIYRSEDFGVSWETINDRNLIDNGSPVFCLSISPLNSNLVYAGTAPLEGRSKIFVTRDGDTWNEVTQNLPDRFPNDIVCDPHDLATAYVVYSGFGEGQVFKTSDFGETWVDISSNLPQIPTNAIMLDPKFPDHIYVGNDLGVFFSRHGGLEWQYFGDGMPQATIVMDLKYSPIDRSFWAATHGNGAYKRELVGETSSVEEEVSFVDFDVKIYPVPTMEVLNISVKNVISKNVNFFITDISGKVLGEYYNKALNANNDLKLDVSHLESGLYILQIVSEGNMLSRKFLKLK